MMMSGPLPDWMAAVMRGWRSLALMNSNTTSAPRALEASPACRFSSTSQAGMKSTQRRILSRVPWAYAGARRAARMPSSPAAAVTPAAAVPEMKVRRVRPDGPLLASSRSAVAINSSSRSEGLDLVDLLQLAFRPLHGVLRLHALDALGVHVRDDVFCERLGGLRRGRPRIAEQPRGAGGGAEHLERLVQRGPHRILLPLLRGAHAVAFLGLEPLPVVPCGASGENPSRASGSSS